MSADNGVYILQTLGPEYRVRHMQAVENYYWDDEKKANSDDPDIWVRNARQMWSNCVVHTDRMRAYEEADQIYTKISEDGFPVEYGICVIEIPRKF